MFGLLLAGATVGCGAVDDGACASEMEDDGVPCTLDVCNAEGGGWAHLPNNNLCEAGQRCDPTGGCVAAGVLTGNATLYGETDSSGITVTVEGLEGVSTTTDAAGNWSLGALPPGTFDITYSKAGYLSITDGGVGVTDVGASSPPDVVLQAGYHLNQEQVTFYSGYFSGPVSSPSGKSIVYLQRDVAGIPTFYGYRLDQPVQDAKLYDQYGASDPYIGDDYVAWTRFDNTVWAKPLNGGPAHLLASAIPNDEFTIVGTVTQYVILRLHHYTGVFDQYSLFVVKADGSTPIGAPVYVTPDANHGIDFVVNNDTTAVVGLYDSTGSPTTSPLLRIDLASGAKTVVNAGFATSDTVFTSMSPDRTQITGYLIGTGWKRAFLMAIDGTAQPALAPDYGATANPKFSDFPVNEDVRWLPDSSGAVYQSQQYTKSDMGIAEGGLKLWLVGQSQSTLLVPLNSYGSFTWSVHNKSVLFRDTTTGTSPMRIVSAHSTSPQIYPLDVFGAYIQDYISNDEGGTTYIVWTQSLSSGNTQRNKVFATLITPPLTAAPQVVQLGGTIPAACNSEFYGWLSDHTYWQLCNNTGVLNGYPELTMAASTIPNVLWPVYPLPDADSAAYVKFDGKLYTSPNTGALTESRLVSDTFATTPNKEAAVFALGKGLIFRDGERAYMRASAADGSMKDKPLTSCQPDQFSSETGYFTTDPTRTFGWWFSMPCGQSRFEDFALPAENAGI